MTCVALDSRVNARDARVGARVAYICSPPDYKTENRCKPLDLELSQHILIDINKIHFFILLDLIAHFNILDSPCSLRPYMHSLYHQLMSLLLLGCLAE